MFIIIMLSYIIYSFNEVLKYKGESYADVLQTTITYKNIRF